MSTQPCEAEASATEFEMMLSDDVAANNPRGEPEKPMDKPNDDSDVRDQVKQLGERIGYGRTIQLCEELWPREHSEPWTVIERKQLQAEITRLQNECDEFRRAHKVATDDCELRAREYAKLKAECDRLQTENSNLHKHVAELAEERDRLQIENENLRAELQRAGTELGTLRAAAFASVAFPEGT